MQVLKSYSPDKKSINRASLSPLTTTLSPFSLPSSRPALPLLRCLFLLHTLAIVAVQCSLVFPHFSMLLLNGKAYKGAHAHTHTHTPPIPHNIFLYLFSSYIFCKTYPSHFLPSSSLHRLCSSISHHNV